MATITATTPTSLSVVVSAGAVQKRTRMTSTSMVLGLPAMERRGRLRCYSTVENKSSASKKSSNVSLTAALMAAVSAVSAVTSPAIALVNERMSTEGTGLPFGLSNNLLGCCSTVENKSSASKKSSNVSLTAALMAAASAISEVTSPAIALVDERMSTEGTGLPFGLSNNLLGWILFGIFGLIWTLYFVYTSTLDEDEDSGLSL